MFMSPGSPVQGFAGHACHRDIFSEGVNNFHVFALLIPAGNCGVKKMKGSLVVEKAPGISRGAYTGPLSAASLLRPCSEFMLSTPSRLMA